jgi:hypothetical protein
LLGVESKTDAFEVLERRALEADALFTTVYVLAHGRLGDAVLGEIKLLNTVITGSSQPGVEIVLSVNT